MPATNRPAGMWLSDRISRLGTDVGGLKKQETEYIVNANRECVAITGNIEHAPLPDGGTEATGLVGWGLAARDADGNWRNLAAKSVVPEPGGPGTVVVSTEGGTERVATIEGNGAKTSYLIRHNFGTRMVAVTVFDSSWAITTITSIRNINENETEVVFAAGKPLAGEIFYIKLMG